MLGVGPTLFFSDRPERIAGQARTADFVGHWTKGNDNFAANPPNATLSIFGEKDVSSSVVVLTNPKLDRNTLSYTVKVLEGKLPASFKEASLFIDILGRWRMAAAGMALGEARGYEMGQAAARQPAPAAPAPAAAPPPPAPRPAAPSAAPPTPAPPTGVTASQADAVAKLKELKSLVDQGVITKSQYQEDSQKLLDQIVR